jgi:hypothetical protein
MKPELETYYNNYFDIFNTEGWKQLLEDFKSNANIINSVEATKDVDDMFFRKGQLNVLAHLINFEAITTNSFEDLQNNPEDD